MGVHLINHKLQVQEAAEGTCAIVFTVNWSIHQGKDFPPMLIIKKAVQA